MKRGPVGDPCHGEDLAIDPEQQGRLALDRIQIGFAALEHHARHHRIHLLIVDRARVQEGRRSCDQRATRERDQREG